ncbi:MAG: GAF domain-containing protein [Polyangiales bacterium]
MQPTLNPIQRIESRGMTPILTADVLASVAGVWVSTPSLKASGELPSARVERQLATAQQITHIGSWEWELATNRVTWSDELYRIYGLEPQSVEITFESFLARVHPEDREHTQREVGMALERGGRFDYPERIVRPDGSIRELETIGEVALDPEGKVVGLIGTCRDVTEERKRDEAIRIAQRNEAEDLRILERIVSEPSLGAVLDAIARSIERRASGTIASILLLDGGGRIRHGAAPSLPEGYVRAIDGVPIGPRAGSCGTAAFRREAVIVSDIATDPLWDDYRATAMQFGLRACWSTPIVAKDGRVLGTFALYSKQIHVPDDVEERLVARAVHLAGIAIERHQLEEQLRALSAHVEEVREEERTGIAREVHDELGQALTALKMDIAWIGRRLDAPELVEKASSMSSMIDETIDVVRRISAELRPGVLDDIGLRAAIEWQSQELQRRIGVRCTVSSNLGDEKLDRAISTTIFRIFQEALTNVARHAKATSVSVSLERRGDELLLEVTDDGRGITHEEASRPSSLGLLGIRERARRFGGEAIVAPDSSRGTRVALRIPLVRS